MVAEFGLHRWRHAQDLLHAPNVIREVACHGRRVVFWLFRESGERFSIAEEYLSGMTNLVAAGLRDDGEMGNPWLDISESDYVGHMSSPVVNQRPVLGRLLRDALESARPGAVLVLGCSTGNGLEHGDATDQGRVSRFLDS